MDAEPVQGVHARLSLLLRRRYHEQFELGAGDEFATVILVKTNLPEVLRRELARPAWTREQVAVGTATDPYQPIEGHYKLTRQSLEALCAARTPVGLVTKGPMVVRDADLFTAIAARGLVHGLCECPVGQRRCMAPSRTRYRVTLAAVEGCASAGRRGCACRRADGTARPGHHGRPRVDRIDDPCGCRSRRALRWCKRAVPARWHAHPLPGVPRARVPGAHRGIRRALRGGIEVRQP